MMIERKATCASTLWIHDAVIPISRLRLVGLDLTGRSTGRLIILTIRLLTAGLFLPTIAAGIRRGLLHVKASRVIVAPDCGMKYLPRDLTFKR